MQYFYHCSLCQIDTVEELQHVYPNVAKKELKIIHFKQKHDDILSYCIHPSCQKAFIYQREMQMHYQKVHLKQRKQCLYCPKSFASKEFMRLHTEDKHPEKVSKPLTFKCEFNADCQSKFSAFSMLRLHLNSKHSAKYHERAHNRPKKMCTLCGKSFCFTYISTHMNTVHSTSTYSCNQCDRVFNGIEGLRSHVKRIHQGNTNPPVPCPMCGKVVKRRQLKMHIAAIHKKIRHQCKICEKSYVAAHDLEWHVKSFHMGQKPKCRICAMEFGRPADRNRHERQNHAADS